MSVNLRSDGKAVDVVIPGSYTDGVAKGDLIVAQGWYGVAMNDGVAGDTIAIEVTQREFVFTVDAGVSAAKGAVLYLDGDNELTDDADDGDAEAPVAYTPVLKVTKAKDSNNVIWAKLLPQLS